MRNELLVLGNEINDMGSEKNVILCMRNRLLVLRNQLNDLGTEKYVINITHAE